MVSPLTDQTRLRAVTSLPTAEVDGELMLMNLEQGKYHGLNPMGRIIFQRLAEPLTVGELIAALEAEYDAPPGVIRAEAGEFLAGLLERRLVEVVA